MALLELVGTQTNGHLLLDGGAPRYLVANGDLLDIRLEKTADAAALLLLTKRGGWVVLDLSGNQTSVNGRRVAGVKRVRHGDRISVGGAAGLFREVVEKQLSADSGPIARGDDCYVCYCKFEANQTVIHCPVCGVVHHQDCWSVTKATCASCNHRVPMDNGEVRRRAPAAKGSP